MLYNTMYSFLYYLNIQIVPHATEESLPLPESDDFTIFLITESYTSTKFLIIELQRSQNGIYHSISRSCHSRESMFRIYTQLAGSQDLAIL
jgi:hypothetical protein